MRQTAFSLVELSIVLVILGLLTGGILGGQSLIRAAEIRSVATDNARISTAVMTFRDKYFALPGDMVNATAFWTSAGGNGANAACDAAVNASSNAICNGNGEGAIESNGAVAYNERFYAWKELANAGLIEGNYLGRSNTGSGSPALTPGVDSPRPKIGNAGYTLTYIPSASGHTELFDGSYNFNTLYLGAISGTPPLKPEESWNIDVKLDDGRPAYGKIFTGKSTGTYSPNCATTAVASTAEYSLMNSGKACTMWLALN